MKSFVGQLSKASSSSANQLSLVKPEFRRGFTIPALPYQQYGILSRALWPSRSQVLRIIPGYDPATGEIFRQNTDCTKFSMDAPFDNYLSDTFCRATVVSRFGSVTTPFLSDYAPGSADARKWGGETVLHAFIRSIMYATSPSVRHPRLKPIKEWSLWTTFGPSATLAFDSPALLMQALVFTVNGRENTDLETQQPLVDKDGDTLPLLAVVALDNKAAIANLCQALVEPTNPGLPLDAATNNKYGALAEVNGNKLFLNTYTDPKTNRSSLRPSVQPAGQTGWTPVPFPLSESIVKQLWHPWEELLRYMTAEEQLRLCAAEFGADTVNYVIGTDRKFAGLPIPDEIRSAGLGRYAIVANEGASATVSGTLSKSASAVNSMSFGMPKAAPSVSFGTPAANPQTAEPYKPDMSSVKNITGIDTSEIMKQVEALRKATASEPTEAQQAANAASLLGDENVDEVPWKE